MEPASKLTTLTTLGNEAEKARIEWLRLSRHRASRLSRLPPDSPGLLASLEAIADAERKYRDLQARYSGVRRRQTA